MSVLLFSSLLFVNASAENTEEFHLLSRSDDPLLTFFIRLAKKITSREQDKKDKKDKKEVLHGEELCAEAFIELARIVTEKQKLLEGAEEILHNGTRYIKIIGNEKFERIRELNSERYFVLDTITNNKCVFFEALNINPNDF